MNASAEGRLKCADGKEIRGTMPMEMYQHDSAAMFRFVLRGDLVDGQIQDLEHAWTTAKSTLQSKDLVVDVSGVTHADESGMDLLSRMRESGACLTAVLPPKSRGFLRSLGLSAAAPSGRFTAARMLRLLWRTAVPESTYHDLGGDQQVDR